MLGTKQGAFPTLGPLVFLKDCASLLNILVQKKTGLVLLGSLLQSQLSNLSKPLLSSSPGIPLGTRSSIYTSLSGSLWRLAMGP